MNDDDRQWAFAEAKKLLTKNHYISAGAKQHIRDVADGLLAAVERGRQAEREDCAKIADRAEWNEDRDIALAIACQIRARARGPVEEGSGE